MALYMYVCVHVNLYCYMHVHLCCSRSKLLFQCEDLATDFLVCCGHPHALRFVSNDIVLLITVNTIAGTGVNLLACSMDSTFTVCFSRPTTYNNLEFYMYNKQVPLVLQIQHYVRTYIIATCSHYFELLYKHHPPQPDCLRLPSRCEKWPVGSSERWHGNEYGNDPCHIRNYLLGPTL